MGAEISQKFCKKVLKQKQIKPSRTLSPLKSRQVNYVF